MFVKMVDETLQIANMPDEEAISKGYKPAVFTDKPITEEGYHSVSHWTEEAGSYVQSWDIEEDEEPIPTPKDILEILLGGETA